jgi:hypothetical protein
MYRIHLKGNYVEIDEHDFKQLISGTVESSYEMAKLLYTSQLFGFPHTIQHHDVQCLVESTKLLAEFESQIDDKDLHKSLQCFRKNFQRLLAIDERIADWVAEVIGLSYKDMQELERFLRLHAAEENAPKWITEPEYLALLGKSIQVMDTLVVQLQDLQRAIGIISISDAELNTFQKELEFFRRNIRHYHELNTEK